VEPHKPRIGMTPDIEWRDEPGPARAHDGLDAQLVEALQGFGALPVMPPHDESATDERLTHVDGLVPSGGEWQFPHRHRLSGDGRQRVTDDGPVDPTELPDGRFAMGAQWHAEFLLNDPDCRRAHLWAPAGRPARHPFGRPTP
jgi:gamma-glutamyl-gamma-aminobutyrate hydrolase PuuD